MRHYKMSFLIHGATLEGNQRSSIALYPSSVDYDAFVHLSNIKKNIKGFVESGKNLLIHSKNTGNGKTSWSIKLLLSWFDCVWPYTDFECRGLFISMPKFSLEKFFIFGYNFFRNKKNENWWNLQNYKLRNKRMLCW